MWKTSFPDFNDKQWRIIFSMTPLRDDYQEWDDMGRDFCDQMECAENPEHCVCEVYKALMALHGQELK
jgi:hypothetical protein